VSEQRPLRILSIAHSAVRNDAGRLRYYPLALRRDVDVHLVVPAVWKEFNRTIVADPAITNGLTVHILPIQLSRAGPIGWYLHFYPGLRKLLHEVDPDVLHLWEEPWSVVALQARFLKKRAALVMEVDQNILKRLPPPFEMIRKEVLRHTDHLLSRSPDATAVVRARGYTGPVTPIGYGVDQKTFNTADGSPVPRSDSTRLRIGYVGRLIEEKGIDDALDAIARSKAPVSLSIMGEGPYEGALRKRIDELGLSERVTFQKWGTPAEVAQFLRGLDTLVLLTRTTKSVREQFGRVIVEAQACGVPVIGSESGSIPSVVGQGGWVVPEHDPDAVARLLELIAANPDLRNAAGDAARNNVLTRFTYTAVAETLVSACFSAARSTGAIP
jgi:glycosyltransferase involved in cell wall biosynthesis